MATAQTLPAPQSSFRTPVKAEGNPGQVNEEATYRKVTRRLLPFLFLCYVVAFLDRVNVGFARLQMLSDLKMTDAVYGAGAGVFFLGYFLFEVPSNLLLERVGARTWITRIMLTWAVVSGLTVWVTGSTSLYVLRFLLGVAEAGFFPGMFLGAVLVLVLVPRPPAVAATLRGH